MNLINQAYSQFQMKKKKHFSQCTIAVHNTSDDQLADVCSRKALSEVNRQFLLADFMLLCVVAVEQISELREKIQLNGTP